MDKDMDAIDIVRQMVAEGQVSQDVAETYFPELAESEDEKIRKELIAMVKLSCTNGDDVDKKIAWLEKQGEQKPDEWSEEYEKAIDLACSILYSNFNENENFDKDQMCVGEIIDKLNSIKRKVQPQPRQEWSEEDEEILYSIINDIEIRSGRITLAELKESYTKQIDWLKSLRPRNTCKPNDLPHWKKSTLPLDDTTGFNGDYFCHKGYNINEMILKLHESNLL